MDQARCFTGKKFETFCIENNITPIFAPANDHRAIGLVERLIQTIKRQLSCIKTQLNKKFNLEHSLYAIIKRLRISKQKTIDITPFEAHFGRKRNTTISSITTKPNNKNLNYNKIIKHYLDEDTIPGRAYLTEEQWADTAICSDTEIEKAICAANARARKEEQKMKDGEQRLIKSEGVSRPIPCSERSIQVKLASDKRRTSMDFMKCLLPEARCAKSAQPRASLKSPIDKRFGYEIRISRSLAQKQNVIRNLHST